MACEALKARLDNAIAAHDRLVNGESVFVIVDAFRSRVEYTKANLSDLKQAIARLQVEYDKCINPGKRIFLTRPIHFRF